MPFNMAMMGIGGRTFMLTIDAEDLSINYIIESEVLSAYPTSGGTIAGDVIQLTISNVALVAQNISVYAIDGYSIHDDALLNITLVSGCIIRGRGGNGGSGGSSTWVTDPELDYSNDTAGGAGSSGGTAIRFGCETNIFGTGSIELGYGGGGGGGGGAGSSSTSHGGGGGGGGSPLGVGGVRGTGDSGDGVAGGIATQTDRALGGASGGGNGGAGGDGADVDDSATVGADGVVQSGGVIGSNGDAIDSQGFTNTQAVGITIVGSII